MRGRVDAGTEREVADRWKQRQVLHSACARHVASEGQTVQGPARLVGSRGSQGEAGTRVAHA
jgi:hypothetical protein